MKLKTIIIVVLTVLFVTPSKAVLKEDSLSNTLRILRSELTTYHDEYGEKQTDGLTRTMGTGVPQRSRGSTEWSDWRRGCL